jgi:hypothetical protein
MAKRRQSYKHYSVMANVAGAGALVAGSNAQDTAGTGNYVEKVNFRRETDGEVRREGWEPLEFDNAVVDQLNNENEPIRMLEQFESEGKNVLVASAADKIYRYDEGTEDWKVIAKGLYNLDKLNYDSLQLWCANPSHGYGLTARRWECIAIDGYIIFNNGIDLPLYYREDWPCAFPMFSLRERGIIRAGTISEFDGRLFLADVEYFDETVINNFDYYMSSSISPYHPPEHHADYDTHIHTYRVPHTIEFSAWRLATDSKDARSAPHLFGQNYQGYISGITGSGDVKYIEKINVQYTMGGTRVRPIIYVSGLSHSPANGWYIQSETDTEVYENRGYYGMYPNDWKIYKGIANNGQTQWMIREPGNAIGSAETWYEKQGIEQAPNIIEPTNMRWYRAVNNGSGTTNYYYDEDYQEVESSYESAAIWNFNPYFDEAFTEGVNTGVDSHTYEWSTLVVGDGIRAIVTSTNGAVKTYDLKVTGIESATFGPYRTEITIEPLINGTAAGVPVPATDNNALGDTVEFILLKEPDILSDDLNISREAADSMSFPEDGTTIVKMAKLADKLLVHRQTGYLAISRGTGASPFFYEEKYRGERVADFRHTVININSQRQMFAGFNGVYSVSPASVEPEPFLTFTNGPEFWRSATTADTEYIYACENNLTQEVHLNCPLEKNDVVSWSTLSYDMIQGTLSEMDYAFSAMASLFPTETLVSRKFIMACHVVEATSVGGIPIHNPAKFFDSKLLSTEDAAITNTGPRLVQYGYGVKNGLPYRIFHRSGLDYDCVLTFGKSDFGDKFSEKKMRSYAIHMSDIFSYSTEGMSPPVAAVANIKLSTYSTSQQTETEEVTQDLDDLSAEVMIPVFAQGNYYQDRIILSGYNKEFKVLGRTFEVSGVRTRMTSEVVNDAA